MTQSTRVGKYGECGDEIQDIDWLGFNSVHALSAADNKMPENFNPLVVALPEILPSIKADVAPASPIRIPSFLTLIRQPKRSFLNWPFPRDI